METCSALSRMHQFSVSWSRFLFSYDMIQQYSAFNLERRLQEGKVSSSP